MGRAVAWNNSAYVWCQVIGMSDQKCSITFMMISTRQYLEDVSMELSPIISYFESRKSEAYIFFCSIGAQLADVCLVSMESNSSQGLSHNAF